MPRYFLHVHYGDQIASDNEGIERKTLEEARAEALIGIRSILAEELRSGQINLGGRIVIMSERNQVVLTVPFSEAVAIQRDRS